jgi:hypothetical protein
MRNHAPAQLVETRQPTRLASSAPAAAIDQMPTAREDLGGLLLQLQRTHGNRHVQRLVEQGRLRVSRPSDRTERDADRTAQALPGTATPPRGEASIAGRFGPDIDVSMERAIRQASGRGQPLPRSVRKPMEQQLDADFARVRLHTDARADQLSRSLQALAFTAGNDIFFRRGGYGPGSATGRYLLAHELTHVTQQQSGTGQPAVQRYIASVNHALRDPKAEPKDDYGTYRSLDVALKAGGGEVYKGPNTADKGGKLDQLTKDPQGVKLKEAEDLYLVGHGSPDKIGNMSPNAVAAAVANITPPDWKGKIFSLNCWSGYRVRGASSALEKLQESLAEGGRKNIGISGPTGVSIRHRDWLDEGYSVGMKAVFAGTDAESKTFKKIVEDAHRDVGIKDPEVDFDAALREEFEHKAIDAQKKATFATEWGRAFQAKVVTKLETDVRLTKVIAKDRVLLSGSEAHQSLLTLATVLKPGEQRIVERIGGKHPQMEPHAAAKLSVAEPLEEKPSQAEPPLPEGSSWTWLWIAGVGLVGMAALGAGMWLIKRK